jgi:sterol desaturase/sphingolipid hydroxylase (fatty acid hydroxylase superfamily)
MYCVIFTLGYFTVGSVVTFEDPIFSAFFWTFFQIGYVAYDLCHYALHHIDTSKAAGGYFHDLQRYHNQHHFGGEEAGFGVSSKLWDIVFRTGYKRTKKE